MCKWDYLSLQTSLHIVCIHMSVYATQAYPNICMNPMRSAICQMQANVCHMPNLEWWPTIVTNLIN